MANKQRGEVDVVVGDATYTLRLTINAICELEEKTGKSVTDLAESIQSEGGMRAARTIMWACLRHKYPDMTEEGAGELMTTIGITESSAAINRALVAAFPPAKQNDTAQKRKKPLPLQS